MAAKTYRAKVMQRIKRTPSIESFRFLTEEKINFAPGQFLRLIFDEKNPENKDLNKYLSFSCAPGNNYIEVTKRLSTSEFSQKLNGLQLEDEILVQAPLGNCIFKEEYKRIAFLIGGIGITPVVSIIEYIIGKKLDTHTLLFYSNRREEEIAFRQELDAWSESNNNLKIIYTLTDYQPRDKSCIFGRIDKKLLLEYVKDLEGRVLFIFGPPKMVEAMAGLSREIGAPEENIKTESFLGY
jgi:ferredoxin-NADP reductase